MDATRTKYISLSLLPFVFLPTSLAEAQRTRRFEIELTKSEDQMRQAAATANQAERLQQVSKEKALLEMEYLRREGDGRLAALNTRREPGTQGIQDRARNDDNDDNGLGETTPLRFLLVGIRFLAYRKRR